MSLQILKIENECTACGACVSICPKNALSLVPHSGRIGFYYPALDDQKCVHCGLCENVCPKVKELSPNTNRGVLSAFMLQANDPAILEQSSSGGVFSIFAQEFERRGGIIWGSAYDFESRRLKIVSTDDEPISLLRKSKYIESYSGSVFRDVRQNLKMGRWCLFVGTPCQISGLNQYLKATHTSDDKLLSLRFVCHGVPSNSFFNQWLSRQEKKHHSRTVSFDFRPKTNGWRCAPSFQINMDNGHNICFDACETRYYRSFIKNELLRRSCYNCKEICYPNSDLTMGDFWGIIHYRPDFKDNRGLSLLLTHSKKGIEFLDSVKQHFVIEPIPAHAYEYLYQEVENRPKLLLNRLRMEKHVNALGYMRYTWLRYSLGIVKERIRIWSYKIYRTVTSK